MKMIIQSGIKEVIYLSDKYSETDSTKASKKMFNQSGIKLRQLIPPRKSFLVNLNIE